MSNITKVYEIGKEHQVQSTKMDYILVQKPEEQITTHTHKKRGKIWWKWRDKCIRLMVEINHTEKCWPVGMVRIGL